MYLKVKDKVHTIKIFVCIDAVIKHSTSIIIMEGVSDMLTISETIG